MILIIYLSYILVLSPILIFIDTGFNINLYYYFYDLFYGYSESDSFFRICFAYLFIASIYRYARFRKFVWDDLHKIFSDK